MSSVEDLDDLIARLERAAEQLRSGEVSSDVAASIVEDCAAVAGRAASELERLMREADLAQSSGQDAPPGQDTLL
jgi:hypothetical protein